MPLEEAQLIFTVVFYLRVLRYLELTKSKMRGCDLYLLGTYCLTGTVTDYEAPGGLSYGFCPQELPVWWGKQAR